MLIYVSYPLLPKIKGGLFCRTTEDILKICLISSFLQAMQSHQVQTISPFSVIPDMFSPVPPLYSEILPPLQGWDILAIPWTTRVGISRDPTVWFLCFI